MSRPEPVRAVVTNDDGIASPGLRSLARAALAAGCEVLVAAPDHDASGSSASMTAVSDNGRFVMERRKLEGLEEVTAYAVPAAPAFIAFLAVREAFGPRPDLVLSGINRGPNTGLAVLHSGTVGAALTAVGRGVRAAAFSLDVRGGTEHWETAEAVAAEVIPALAGLPHGQVLNVNVPSLPRGQLRGIRQGRLAAFGAVQVKIISSTEEQLQLTLAEPEPGSAPGTDSALLAAGYASVTALQAVCEEQAGWLPWAAPSPAPAARPG